MTKTICDICGKEMGLYMIPLLKDNLKDMQFAITTHGRIWDVCQECRDDLWIWIKDRKECPVCQESQ